MSQKEFEKIQNLNWENWKGAPLEYFVLGLNGECGELANITKKYLRYILGWKGNFLSTEEYIKKLKDELADIQIYLYLVAGKFNLNLEDLVKEKMEINIKRFEWRKE